MDHSIDMHLIVVFARDRDGTEHTIRPPRINRRFPSPPALRPAAAVPSRHGAGTHQTAAHIPC